MRRPHEPGSRLRIGSGLGLALGLALALAACEGEGGVGAACYDEVSNFLPPDAPDCSLETPCPTVNHDTMDCQTFPNPTEPVPYDPAEGACVVDFLRTGGAGLVVVDVCNGAIAGTSTKLHSYGDGTVLYHEGHMADSPTGGRSTMRALPDAAYFDACDSSTIDGFLACIEGILDQECLGEPTCA